MSTNNGCVLLKLKLKQRRQYRALTLNPDVKLAALLMRDKKAPTEGGQVLLFVDSALIVAGAE